MSWAEDQGYDAFGFGDNIAPSILFVKGKWTDALGNTKKIKNMDIGNIENCIRVLKKSMENWSHIEEDEKEINDKILEFEKEISKRHKFKGRKF